MLDFPTGDKRLKTKGELRDLLGRVLSNIQANQGIAKQALARFDLGLPAEAARDLIVLHSGMSWMAHLIQQAGIDPEAPGPPLPPLDTEAGQRMLLALRVARDAAREVDIDWREFEPMALEPWIEGILYMAGQREGGGSMEGETAGSGDASPETGPSII